ncbi:hypothetical protein ACHHYP_02837 [Achlya hypogyna]|uniref:Secreted protein n=1 Tax=Achlya hypogyna TaxID=1202772 RepID=A0A1V9ZSH4_ACHHY|nr:hypothetical protein ACHHYP_02837 [Achlya hypogyna]
MVSVAAVILISTVLLAAALLARRRQLSPLLVSRHGDAYVTLMVDEASMLGALGAPPTITATTFVRIDTEYVVQRVHAIVRANPWLLGRLVRRGANIELQYDLKAVVPANIVSCVHAAPEDLINCIRIGSGYDCLGKENQSLFEVIVATLADGQAALVMALSHAIGDGATYYALFKMLDYRETVLTLDPVRPHHDKAGAVKECTGQAPAMTRAFSLARISYKIAAYSWQHLQSLTTYRVRTDVVKQLKAAHIPTDTAPFLSTHDIVASAFFSVTNTTLGCVPVDLRSRLRLPPTTAGNYAELVPLSRIACSTPAAIRRAFRDKTGPIDVATADFPDLGQALLGGRLTLLTNWRSFYHHLALASGECATGHDPLAKKCFVPLDACGVLYQHTPNELRVRATADNLGTHRLFEPLVPTT